MSMKRFNMKDDVTMQYKISTNILQLMMKKKVVIKQINGQRRLNGPPPGWAGPPPGPNTEVFVGNLPRKIYEDTLYPFFAEAGFIYELRLMMDFSGNNRGYCFVTYATSQEAKNAIQMLHNKELVPGHRVGVIMSVNNCKLWIGKLPKRLETMEIIMKICAKTAEVNNVFVYRSEKDEAEYAIVEYKSHRGAAMARRILLPDKNSLFVSRVRVDWANPEMWPCNVIEDSGVAVKDENKKDVFIIKEIRRKIIGHLYDHQWYHSNFKSREEILHENIECYMRENIIIPTSDINMPSTSNQRQAFLQFNKEPSNSSKTRSPILFRTPTKLAEQPPPSFSLFDGFRFSDPAKNKNEDHGWAPFDQLQEGTVKKDGLVNGFTPRFSNLSLQTEDARHVETSQRGQIPPISPPKPVSCPKRGFPFHQSETSNVVPNARPCLHATPPQMPYYATLNNRGFYGYNQQNCMLSNCARCSEEIADSNLNRMPAPCNLPGCNENQHAAVAPTIKSCNNLSGEKPKRVVKVSGIRRRNNSKNQRIARQQSFWPMTPEQVPMGGRPIFGAGKKYTIT